MPTADIRVLTEEDFERWKYIEGLAFMAPAEDVERYAEVVKPEYTLAAYADGALQAYVSSLPMTLGLEGSGVRMGGVTSVACMPEYRRQGLVAQLLPAALKRSRDLGEPLSSLWTPHPALYRRYGWDICTESMVFEFNPKQVQLEAGPKPAGKIVRLTKDDWPEAQKSYYAWASRRNSVAVRDQMSWQMRLGSSDKTLYVYRDEAGRPAGHAIMRATPGHDDAVLHVPELVANSAGAYRALLALVLSHDLVSKVRLWAAIDEPLFEVLVDPGQVKREPKWGLFLRIVDVHEAFALRPAYADGRLVLRLRDEVCSWNDGVWEIACAGSHMSAERVDEEPMLTVDARALAQLYNGYQSATNLARAGRVEAHHPRALAIADVLLAMRTRPFCLDDF